MGNSANLSYLMQLCLPIAILNNLDETTKPCDDFYQYSCGGFLKRTSLPDGKDKIGEDTKSQDFIQNSLKDIFENEEIMSNYSKVITLLSLGHTISSGPGV